MQARTHSQWLPSGKSRPCPVCGRTKDGDCRISDDGLEVICHHPKDLKPGTVENGWAFTGNTSDGRAGHFAIDKGRTGAAPRSTKVVPLRPTAAQAPIDPATITLARLPKAGRVPPEHWPNGQELPYGSDGRQWVKVVVKADGSKAHIPHHRGADGKAIAKGGPDPWPLWCEAMALEHGPDLWIVAAEGEKCAAWFHAGGLVAVSQPGHSHTPKQIQTRFARLLAAGVAGVVYLADADGTGKGKARQCATAAAAAGLPFLWVRAEEVWPADMPKGGSIDDAPGTAAERVAKFEAHLRELKPLADQVLHQQEVAASGADGLKRIRLAPDEVMARLPQMLGRLRLNIRNGDVVADAGVLTGNQISRLYLELSTSAETWPKEATADAVAQLASRDPYDPVREYLESITAEPLPLDQWQRLDRHLLGITDSIAAKFLPRFLISAVARTFEPGCYVRQSPVLVGDQERGKSELGRILFGSDHWVEGVGKLDRDALQRAHTAWGVELAELDGVTRRRDQEHLKAFLTETCDTYQIRYDRCPERHPRRFVFWGTANRPPLRDSTGSTRFVIIPVPAQDLPLEWARQHRDALWARAVEQYRAGITWIRTDAQERQEVEERNADFIERDPWADQVVAMLSSRTTPDTWPVKVPEILNHLRVPIERQTNDAAKRVTAIAELSGWRHGRRTVKGQKLQGLWPGHPGHPEDTPGGVRANSSDAKGSQQPDTPDTPISVKRENRGEGEGQQHPPTATETHAGGSGPFSGCPGCPPDQIDCSATADGVSGGVSAGVSGGVSGGCPPPWLPELLAIRDANPGQPAAVLSNQLMAQHGIDVPGRRVAQLLKAWDARAA